MNDYHILNMKINGVWYQAPKIYNEAEFDALMNLLDWKMPYNLSAYHFSVPAGACPFHNNPIMKTRPVIKVDLEALFARKLPERSLKLQSRTQKISTGIVSKLEDLLIVETEDEYCRLHRIEAGSDRIIADLEVIPITFKQARQYVNLHHRHNVAPQGHKFSIGVRAGSELVGVVIASTPKARMLNDGFTLEVSRCCADELYHNTCSKLYSRAISTGKTMGYRKVITYTLPEESGSSLRAVGFTQDAVTEERPHGWDAPSRRRTMPDRYPAGKKIRWVRNI